MVNVSEIEKGFRDMGKRIQGLVSVKRLDDDSVLSQHFRD